MIGLIKDSHGRGQGWNDPDFPASDASLFRDELTDDQIDAIAHGSQTFRKDKDPCVVHCTHNAAACDAHHTGGHVNTIPAQLDLTRSEVWPLPSQIPSGC